MARATKANMRIISAPKAGRSTAKPAKATAEAPVSKATAAKAPVERAPIVTKDELRAQVEKLERTNATLRAKSREATKAAKAAAARIAELEDEVATLGKQAASLVGAAKRSAKRPRARAGRGVDPGDAVPPGVAVAEPEPLDGEAEKALENLEEHLKESGE